jgi:hypothetical protein
MSRAVDAKARLEAMHYKAPEPSKEAVAQNEREVASRGELGTMSRLWSNFSSHPDVSAAATVGEPTLADPQQTSAPDLVKQANALVQGVSNGTTGSNNSLSVETIKAGEPPASQPIPRSEPAGAGSQGSGIPELQPLTDAQPAASGNSTPASGNSAPAAAQSAPATGAGPEQTGIPELIPDSANQANSNQTTGQATGPTQGNDAPGAQAQAPPPAPAQVNQAATPEDKKAESGAKTDTAESSSSRPKKKKGFLGVF